MYSKFTIRQKLAAFSIVERKRVREEIQNILNVSNSRLSSIINYDLDVKYDFTFTQAYLIAQLLDCPTHNLYTPKFLEKIESDNTKK